MKQADVLAAVLAVVGGVNWGLVALTELDLTAAVSGLEFGETNAATGLVGLLGLGAAYQIAQQAGIRRRWSAVSA